MTGAVLVTGGLGFIGSHTVDSLVELGSTCVIASRRHEPPVDITDRAAVLAIGERHSIAAIVHLAAPAIGANGIVGELRAGVDGLLNVLEAAAAWGARRVVVASSIGVYGGLEDMRALREDAPLPMTAGGNPVAASKQAGELLGEVTGERLGVEVVNARLAAIWGPRGRSRSRIIAAPTLVHAAVRGEQPAFEPPQRTPYADDAIDLCYVRDCGRALALLATAASLCHRTYNVGSGRPTANGELAAVIREQLADVDAALLPGHDPAGPGHAVSLDIARLRADTGYQPRFPVPEAVADYAAWLRAGHEL